MEPTSGIIEPIFEKAEQYAKTNMELWKLKAIDKASVFSSVVMTNMLLFLISLFFIFFLSITMAFYLSDFFGNIYYGFMAVTAFYFTIGLLFFFLRKFIQRRFRNRAIQQFNTTLQ